MATPPDHLDKLLEAAQAGRVDEFRQLLDQTMCIHEYHPKKQGSIVSTLANAGNRELVMIMLNEHHASLDQAVYGAARGGYIQWVQELLDRGAKHTMALMGAATGQHEALIRKLDRGTDKCRAAIMRGTADSDDPERVLTLIEGDKDALDALIGALKSPHRSVVETLLKRFNLQSRNITIFCMAAYYNQLDWVEPLCPCPEYRELFPESLTCLLARGGASFPVLKHSHDLAWALYGAAQAGHFNLMNELLDRASTSDLLNKKIAINWAIRGAGAGDHRKLVSHLVTCGGSIEEALFGAALGKHIRLMDELVTEGTRLGLISKNALVRAAAISKRYPAMNAYLAEGASLNEALSCVSLTGDAVMAQELIRRGANPEWQTFGRWEVAMCGFLDGYSRYAQQQLPPLPAEIHFKLMAHLAKKGIFGVYRLLLQNVAKPWTKEFVEQCGPILAAAAAAGFRSIVTEMLNDGGKLSMALKGAVESRDREFLHTLLTPRSSVGYAALNQVFTTAFDTGQSDLIPLMMTWFPFHTILTCVANAISDNDPKHAIRNLSLINSSFIRVYVAHKANVVPYLSAAHIVQQTGISPHMLLVFAKQPVKWMRLLLQNLVLTDPTLEAKKRHSPWSELPNEIKASILSYVAGVEISQNDLEKLAQTATASRDYARINRMSADESHALGSICRRLKKTWWKSTPLASAFLLVDRTHMFCQPRHSKIYRGKLLPRGMCVMMSQFEKYQNLVALQHWLKACKQYLDQKKLPGSELLSLIESVLDQDPEFMLETSDPTCLARYLQKKITLRGSQLSLYEVVRPLPVWNNLLSRFPRMAEMLEASVTEKAESHSQQNCFQ